MIKLNHECSACGSDFTLQYDELNTESDPNHCPFCGEYMILEEEDFGDADDDDDDEDDDHL
jgi:predicted  nucleic acid-binding Zn-ribbon protein